MILQSPYRPYKCHLINKNRISSIRLLLAALVGEVINWLADNENWLTSPINRFLNTYAALSFQCFQMIEWIFGWCCSLDYLDIPDGIRWGVKWKHENIGRRIVIRIIDNQLFHWHTQQFHRSTWCSNYVCSITEINYYCENIVFLTWIFAFASS